MQEAVSLALAFLTVCSAANPSATTPRRTSWNQQLQSQSQQPRVQAHSGLTVVNPPQLSPYQRASRRGGPMPGYLPLRPVPTLRHPRWYGAETAPKPSYLRAPPSYDRYPPFWSDESSRSGQHRNRHSQPHRHPKKACNPCNSVPWIPIFKSPAGLSGDHHPRQLVPEIEVYPESTIQQHSVILPQTLVPAEAPAVVIEPSHQLVSLPVGNIPVAPSLLLHPEQHIPIPELSPHPIAPIHESIPFNIEAHHGNPNEAPKVVVTISESEAPRDVHLVAQDQHSEPSSFVDTHSPQNFNNFKPHGGLDIVKSIPLAEYTSSIQYPFHFIQSSPYLDINTQPQSPNPTQFTYEKSPNPTQFTYENSPKPTQFTYENSPNPTPFTYEKSPKTGSQKVSDFILAVSKDNELNKNGLHDSLPSGTNKVTAPPAFTVSTTLPELFSTPKVKATRLEDAPNDVLDPNILSPPPLPPHLTQLLPTYDTAYLHPLYPVENKGVASVVNGALLPPPIPQPMNPTTLQPTESTLPPKKIQIIIPYTTYNNQDYDQNALGSGNRPVNTSFVEANKLQTWSPIVVTEPPQNQPRKIPEGQNYQNFKNLNWSENQPSQSSKMQHILASNIRDLLQKEMEPKQNIRLQKNIDNWTALEYSNHKVVGKKQPGDIITHAQAVTSIPGTSISHLLLPSKKIPDGYFTSTLGTNFDEPSTTPFPASSVSVDSKPFTTLSRYSSVVWTGPTTRPTENYRTSVSTTEPDYDIEETTPKWNGLKVSIAPGTNEKVYVVTPVSNWATSRRSTRHIEVTEKYSPQESQNTIFTKLEKLTSTNHTESHDKNKLKFNQKPLYPKSTPLFRIKANQTKYEKISKFNKPKPIAKFFATTVSSFSTNQTSKLHPTSTEPTSAMIATFPFRNGGELPLEMAKVNFSSNQLMFKNTGERKTLIKQMKTNNWQGKEGTTSAENILAVGNNETNSLTAERPSAPLEVEVVFPFKTNTIKKGDPKKPTNYEKKKLPEKVGAKGDSKSSIKPDEPNITEDDREDINSLMKNAAIKDDKDAKETLLAVETAVPPSMPDGVFGQTRAQNSSRSLLDTIKLLRDFLADTSSEEQSQEKTEKIGKVIEKMETKGKEGKKLLKDVYKYNFPEYLIEELHLNKDEIGLVQDAMVELRKNKERKKLES